MMRILLLRRASMLVGLLCMDVLAAGIPVVVQAAPVGQPDSAATGRQNTAQLQTQLKDVDAKISQGRARNAELQSQVTQMERQNADGQKQLQQRDAQIAALQKELQAAGVAAPSLSASH